MSAGRPLGHRRAALTLLAFGALVGAAVAPGAGAQDDPTPVEPPGGGDTATTSSSTTSTTVDQPGPDDPTEPDPEPTVPAGTVTTTTSTVLPGVVREPEGTPEEPPAPRVVPRSELIAPPIDLSSLEDLVSTRRDAAVAAARTAADLANAEALGIVAARTAELDEVLAEAPPLDAAVESTRAEERSAAGTLETARSRTAVLAAESYTAALSGGNAVINTTTEMLLDIEGFGDFVASTEYSGAAWRSLTRGVAEARGWLEAAEERTRVAIESRTELEGRIGAARSRLDDATAAAELVAERGQESVTAAAEMGEVLSWGGLGPTILGATVIGAADLAAFSEQRGRAASSIDLTALAEHFVAEGAAEGVRADIAWAQSILETGNFGYRGSMVSPSDNNYAGIGACDSCSSGFAYASPQMGARAQMQLLRTYADDNLTSDRLANPPVGRAPERSYVRGCCDTWMELSGIWATGPGYGVKILTLYNDMLAFAAARQRAGAGPVVPAPAP